MSATCSGWSSLSQAFCYADLLSLLSKALMECARVRAEDKRKKRLAQCRLYLERTSYEKENTLLDLGDMS